MKSSKLLLLVLIIFIMLPLENVSFAVDSELPNSLEIELGENGLISLSKDQHNNSNAWNTLIEKYKFFIVGFAGIAAVTMVGLFIKNFVALGATGNPGAREEALKGLLFTGLATALLGSVSLITALFYGIFK